MAETLNGTTGPCRGTRPSVSAVLLVGLLIGVTVSAFKPGLGRAIAREGANDGVTTRHITATLTRAVRDLVGTKRATPAVPVLVAGRPTQPEAIASANIPEAFVSTGPQRLRESLLALPPPIA